MSHRGSRWYILVGLLLQCAVLVILCPPAFAQGVLWAKRAGGTGGDQGASIAVDSTGNAYVTGSFTSPATFGAGEASQTVLTSAGTGNMFLAKYQGDGSLLWARGAGGTGSASGSGIALDTSGNIYVTGSFTGSVIFGPGETNETTLTAQNLSDVFIAKFTGNGSLSWVERASSPSQVFSSAIAVDAVGNSFVTGAFINGATFGVGEANETTFSSSALFIAKYNGSGALIWAKHAPGAHGSSIAVDSLGNSYATGASGSATFGPGEANQTVLNLLGSNDCFFAKFNSSGALTWVKQVGGSTNGDVCTGAALALDASAAIYATGLFTGTVTFGRAEMNQTILTGGVDIFVAKYNSDGTFAWTKQAGSGVTNDQGNSIALDNSGGVYLTGLTSFFSTFGAGDSTQTQITSAGSADAFVAKYSNTGTLVWVKQAGGTGYDDARGIAVTSAGVVHVTGRISGNATFGAGEVNQSLMSSSGNTDIFVAKFAADDFLREASVDFDDDGKSDVGIFRDGNWLIRRSSDSQVSAISFGNPTATPVPADYDGDGITDAATYENGSWSIRRSSDGIILNATHGGASFVPIPHDYDSDGKADVAVYLDGVWSIVGSLDNTNTVIGHGGPGWIPLPGDYDGDGKTDIAVYINGAWSVRWSSINLTVVTGHGGPSWEPVPGDYDGDGRIDLAVHSNGAWSILRSSDNSISVVGHGGPSWVPLPADYDGDGKTDIAVYHPVGVWSIIRSSTGMIDVVAHGGGPTDVPLN